MKRGVMGILAAEFGLRSVINAAGTMTSLGAAVANEEAIAAATELASTFVEMPELQRAASRTIAAACGADAGCVTACVASGIVVAVAATMTGDSLARIESLPVTDGLKNEVLLLKGHSCHFSGDVAQMIRLSGAKVVELGAVNRSTAYQLQGAIGDATAAALYVVSHQTAQTGMIELREFIDICHSRNIPVIVDASAEYDLRGFLAQGADLVLYSAHKFLGGLTAGIIAGRKDLVRACYLQEQGIGRAMKVGKEGIASTIAVLKKWDGLDRQDLERQETARSQNALDRLNDMKGISVSLEPDPTGNPITRVRVRVNEEAAGIDCESLRRVLAHGSPAIYVRAHDTDPASLLLDPCNLDDEQMECVTSSISAILSGTDAFDRLKEILPLNENIQNWPDAPPLGPLN